MLQISCVEMYSYGDRAELIQVVKDAKTNKPRSFSHICTPVHEHKGFLHIYNNEKLKLKKLSNFGQATFWQCMR